MPGKSLDHDTRGVHPSRQFKMKLSRKIWIPCLPSNLSCGPVTQTNREAAGVVKGSESLAQKNLLKTAAQVTTLRFPEVKPSYVPPQV